VITQSPITDRIVVDRLALRPHCSYSTNTSGTITTISLTYPVQCCRRVAAPRYCCRRKYRRLAEPHDSASLASPSHCCHADIVDSSSITLPRVLHHLATAADDDTTDLTSSIDPEISSLLAIAADYIITDSPHSTLPQVSRLQATTTDADIADSPKSTRLYRGRYRVDLATDVTLAQ
jgi:hypothetical protein